MDWLPKHKVEVYRGQKISIAQVKFDGYYTEIYKSKSISGGIVICHKKRIISIWPKLKNIDAIKHSIDNLPYETILRCELHAIGVHATSVPTLTNDADPRLLLSPFQIEMWDEETEPQTSFYMEWKLLNDKFPVVPEFYTLHDTAGVAILPDRRIESIKQQAMERKIEGYVVKDFPGGKCWKIKPEKTVDAFVVSTAVSDSDTYAGGLKSVTIAVYDSNTVTEIASVGSGFDGDYRMNIDLKSLIGKVGEFGYQELGAKGRLKFPKFLRWRDDEKTKEQCLINQL